MELDIRNIKTTMGMETLSCKTPQRCEKEFRVYLLAYNLIRLIMAQSALLADVLPRSLSFKHILQLWLVWNKIQTSPMIKRLWSGSLRWLRSDQLATAPAELSPELSKEDQSLTPC